MEIEKLAKKYYGDMAELYDETRIGTPQWNSEQDIVEKLLLRFGAGISVLDIPVGTGRFLDAYSKSNFLTIGIDISSSMLEKARENVESNKLDQIILREGDITSLDFKNDTFDLVVCVRFMDWVNTSFLEKALSELNRVSKETIIVYIMTYTPLAELRPLSPTGFFRLLRQWKLKFYKFRTKSESVTHSKQKILEIFERLDLQVDEQICIDPTNPSGRHWRMGNSRDIYVLRKI